MRLTHFLMAVIACGAFIVQVTAGGTCLCGVSGEDYCATCSRGIRPIPKLVDKLIGPPPKLPPIGDKCWCGKQLVEPAIPPKPCCPKKHPIIYEHEPLVCHSCAKKGYSSCSCGGRPEKPFPKPSCSCSCSCNADFPYPPPAAPQKCPGIPADPVSVGLAYQMGNARRFAVPESKLQYGFYTKPLNAVRRIYTSKIPEEKLWSLNKEIIELKRTVAPKPEEEEVYEEESEEVVRTPSYLSYGELGYCPEKFKSAVFVDLPAPQDAPGLSCLDPPPPIGDCGFKPGSVVPFNQADSPYTFEDCFDLV